MSQAPVKSTPSTIFLQSQDVFKVSDSSRTVAHDLLPGGVYLLEQNIFGFYLTLKNEQPNPSKIYGTVSATADRIISSFKARPGKTTGVLLTGEKGSGKTMLMNNLSTRLAKEGIPTIIVNNNYTGDAFNSFIASITQPAMLAFDEFEKVYTEEQQDEILTLLSGLFETHKLVVMTVNNEQGVNKHMRNRPGRLFYRIRYSGVEEAAIREYCADRLLNKEHIDDVAALGDTIMGFNFDMLVCLVEEMNRYNEPVEKAIKMMNIDFVAFSSSYEVTLIDKNGITHRAEPWHGTLSNETYRTVQFQLGKIENLPQREKLAIAISEYVYTRARTSGDRSESDLDFVYINKEDTDGYEEGMDADSIDWDVGNVRDAISNKKAIKLSSSRWQNATIHLLDSQLRSNRGRTARFETELGEVILQRIDQKPSPFAFGSF